MKTLFENSTVIKGYGTSREILKGVFLAVDGDVISYIGSERPDGHFECIKNLNGNMVIPGLFNCHTHAPMVLLRGVGSDLPLNDWLFEKVFPVEDKLRKEDIAAGTGLAMLEMLASGTVSFSDMYFFPEITAEAVINSGMKANICRPVQSFDPNEDPANSYRLREAVELYNGFNKAGNGRLLIDFCVHAEYTCNKQVTRALCETIKEKGGNLNIHLSETEKEHRECLEKYGVTPAKWFEDLGAFDCGAYAAHCVTVSDEDLDILRKHNVSVVHNPTSNMKLGSGFAPVKKMLDMGINVALGTDGAASNNNLDMLEEMHLASVIHNGYMRDATVLNAGEITDFATINGAKLQRRDKCGYIEVGNKADLAVISLDRPHMRPCLDELALLVYSAQSSDVELTMCEGNILYEKGEYKTLDCEKIYYDTACSVKYLYGEDR